MTDEMLGWVYDAHAGWVFDERAYDIAVRRQRRIVGYGIASLIVATIAGGVVKATEVTYEVASEWGIDRQPPDHHYGARAWAMVALVLAGLSWLEALFAHGVSVQSRVARSLPAAAAFGGVVWAVTGH